MPLYIVLNGSKKKLGVFGAEEPILYRIFHVFISFFELFVFQETGKSSENCAAGELFSEFISKVPHLVLKKASKYLQNRKEFQNPVISSARGFKPPLYQISKSLQVGENTCFYVSVKYVNEMFKYLKQEENDFERGLFYRTPTNA